MKFSLTTPVSVRSRRPGQWVRRAVLAGLLVWIVADLLVPTRHSIRQFDSAEVARLETAMWRSYYDKNPALLFWQLAGGLRQQFHAPFWRSFGLAFRATQAAFTFKQGQSRADYQQALPGLTTYYAAIQALTVERFDVPAVAALELNWWIVHRQRNQYSYQDLATALARTSAALYNQPVSQFTEYGRLRAEAMRLCDESGGQPGKATEADWQRIERALGQAWATLHQVVRKPA